MQSLTKIKAVVDWTFTDIKADCYDAANSIGSAGLEHPLQYGRFRRHLEYKKVIFCLLFIFVFCYLLCKISFDIYQIIKIAKNYFITIA